MEAYHFRITGDREKLAKVSLEFLKKFNPDKYIFCFEVSKADIPHCHGHIEYKNGFTTNQSKLLSSFMKDQGLSGRYYHQKIKKSIEHNILYAIKDKDIMRTDFTTDEITYYQKKTLEIEESKNTQPCQKLINLFKKKYEKELVEDDPNHSFFNMEIIKEFIDDVYILEWDKLAPTNGLTIQYIKTICKKLNICKTQLKLYYQKDL